MNALLVTEYLANLLQQPSLNNIPTVNAVVQSVQGNQITLTQNPSEVSDIFFGGALQFTSGLAQGIYTAIVDSQNGPCITVSTDFPPLMTPAPGDTCQLGPGTLGSSSTYVYKWEPDSTLPTQAGNPNQVPFLVTVNITSVKTVLRTLAGKKFKGWLSFMKKYDFEVVVETPFLLSTGNGDAYRNAMEQLELLAEQCTVTIIDFRMGESMGIWGEGDIEATKCQIQRTGSDWRRAQVIEFSIVCK